MTYVPYGAIVQNRRHVLFTVYVSICLLKQYDVSELACLSDNSSETAISNELNF